MSNEPLALSIIPPTLPAEQDFDAICSTVMASARGRWFLEEYAKRNRNADTTQVLAAIERMQAAIEGDRAQQASRDVRLELHEMARTIARARAAAAPQRQDSAALDIAGAAERLRDIAWTMHACGIELATSEQVGQLAEIILSAASLRNPDDRRASQLSEVLHYLERRIDRMLESHTEAATPANEGRPEAALPRAVRQKPEAPQRPGMSSPAAAAIPPMQFQAARAAAPEATKLPVASPEPPAIADKPMDAAMITVDRALDEELAGLVETIFFESNFRVLLAEQVAAQRDQTGTVRGEYATSSPPDPVAVQLPSRALPADAAPEATPPAVATLAAAVDLPASKTERAAEADGRVGMDSVSRQVEQDLADLFAAADAASSAARKPAPASAQEPAPELGAPAGAAVDQKPPPAEQVAVPSMWEPATPAPAARAPRTEEPADFLLEPLPGGMPPDNAAAADAPADMQVAGENGSFATEATKPPGRPEAAIGSSVIAAQAIAATLPTSFPVAATPPAETPRPAIPHQITGDPLAALNSLTDEERIALFT